MQTAEDILNKVTQERTGTAYSNSVILEAMKLYACEKVKEALKLAAERLPSKDTGRSGCSYGDTEFDSESVVYGFNMAIDYCGEKVLSLETEIVNQINKEI